MPGRGQVRSLAFDAGVEVLGERVVHHADSGAFVDGYAEGDADVGVEVEEVVGAVYGVDDEGWGGGEGVAGLVGFFAHESGLWLVM